MDEDGDGISGMIAVGCARSSEASTSLPAGGRTSCSQLCRIRAHIDNSSENCLAHLEGLPDGSDLWG
jgi:hypothetical protein